MPYITQECMQDFYQAMKEDYHFSNRDIDRIKGAMQYYFGFKVKKHDI